MRIFEAWRNWRNRLNFVERQRLLHRAGGGDGVHPQGVQFCRLGARQAAGQVILAVVIHQKADRAAVHAVDRHVEGYHLVDGFQHEPVAAERDDNSSLRQRAVAVACDQFSAGLGCDRCRRCDEGDLAGQDRSVFRNWRTGRKIAQIRFLCSSTGMSRRTLAVRSWSIRAVVQPMPSDTWATRWPHGLTIIEWP